jgi:phosphate starvation-inducible PhoH-like protein
MGKIKRNRNKSIDLTVVKDIRDELLYDENKFTKPKNKSQYKYVRELDKKNNKIIVATGPAGTGKTMFATEYAIKDFLLGNCDKIIFTRPSVSADENIGFLPGSLEDKMAPWIRPIYDILYNFIHPNIVKKMITDKLIEISPLGFMRGRTFKNCWIVADEMQNSTPSQMKMLLTRLGTNSRIVITGDLEQHDRGLKNNGLEDFLNKFKNKRSESITSVEFDTCDVERDAIVKEVLEIYSGELPINYVISSESSVDDIIEESEESDESEQNNDSFTIKNDNAEI